MEGKFMSDVPKKVRRLHRLTITEVSLVDRPANQYALISLAKRDGSAPDAAQRGQALVDLARQRNAVTSTKVEAFSKGVSFGADAMAAGRTRALEVLKQAGSMRTDAVPVRAEVAISKFGSEDQRYIAGWASVIEKDGKPVVDSQGDQIDEADLVEAAHAFMRDARVGKVLHAGPDAIEIVESLVVRPEVAKAMGIASNSTGWWIGAKVHDDAAWVRVKSGELRSLSIAGTASWEA
jgi:hypothetical protein